MKKEKTISIIIGVVILVVVVGAIVIIKNKPFAKNNAVDIYGAIGGGKKTYLLMKELTKYLLKNMELI